MSDVQNSPEPARLLLPLTAVLVALAYFPGSNVLRWAVLSVLVPLSLIRLSRRDRFSSRATPVYGLMIALLGYALLSLLWALSWTEALNGWWQLALFCGCVLAGSLAQARTVEATYRAFILALLLSVFLAVLQALRGPVWGIDFVGVYPAGLFLNSQLFGEIAALSFLVAPVGGVVQLGLLLGVILSGSRAAILTVALLGGILYVRAIRRGGLRRPDPGILLGVLGILLGLFLAFAKSAILVNEPGPFDSAIAQVSSGRWALWLETLKGMTFFGHGIGSFFVEFPRFVQSFPIGGARPDSPENEILHFAFELGVPGVLLLAGIFAFSLVRASGLRSRLVVLGLLLESCFGFALHVPATVFLGGLVLGSCLRNPERGGTDPGDGLAPHEPGPPR